MMRDVRLRDTMHQIRAHRAQQVAIDRAQRPALEVPRAGAVMRQHGVRVLQVGDHDDPVVDHQVRHNVELCRAAEPVVVVPEHADERDHRQQRHVREEHLASVARVEDERTGVEVCARAGAVAERSRGGQCGVGRSMGGSRASDRD